MAMLLGGGSEQCLALPQVTGGTDLPVEGKHLGELCVGLGATGGRDQVVGCLQLGECRVGLRPDLVVQVGCPLELSGSNLES